MTDNSVNEIEKAKESDYDSAWKEVIEKLFDPFLSFFFPEIHKDIDFDKPIEFLKDELRQIDPDNKLGKRIADALVKVHLKNGGVECLSVLVHIEVEGNPRSKFMERMFVYYYRIFDRLKDKGMEIVSLGILTDDEKNVRPDEFSVNRWGFQLRMKIPIVKMTDYQWDEHKKKELEYSTNPMSMVVRAQLKCHAIKGTDDERRYAAKCELLRECRRRNYGCDGTRTLFRYIGWVIRLPYELERKLIQEINRLEEEKQMQYIPVWEKKAWDEGVAVGIEKERFNTAKKMIQMGIEINIIAAVTEIPIEEIKNLAVEIQMPQTSN
jgi:hypothetical protein